MLKEIPAILKAMDTGTAGEGKEFDPTNLSNVLLKKFRLDAVTEGLLKPVAMPTNPYKFPYEGADATLYKVAESTGEDGTGQNKPTASTPGTADITLTAIKLMARTYFSSEEEEDSIIPILEFVKNKLSLAYNEGMEDILLNGDTTATHMDSDVTATTDCRKSWKGFRKLALANAETKADLSTFDKSTIRGLITKMAKYGIDAKQLAIIVGPIVWNKIKTVLSDLDLYTTNKIGLTGEVAAFDGIPIIVSPKMREDVNATGVYDGTTTTKATLLVVRRDQFLVGTKAGVSVKSDEDIENDQMKVVIRVRKAFTPVLTPSATDPTVVIGYNIAT